MGSCLSTEGVSTDTNNMVDSFSPRSSGAPASSSSSTSSMKRVRRSFLKRRANSSKKGGDATTGSGGCDALISLKGEEQLLDVQGRVILNGVSKNACLFTQQGRKGTNQDAMLVWEDFSSRNGTIFCGVFDGHGPFRHIVARKVRGSLPLKLSELWKVNGTIHSNLSENNSAAGSMNFDETSSIDVDDEWNECTLDDNQEFPEMYMTQKQSFLKSFKLMDKELKLHTTIDCFCSGTTAVTLVKQDQDLVIGNVGDSRAILGTKAEDGSLCAVQLTVDLKPNLPREAARIQQCKGRVFALQDEPEVARVWLPNNDSPGLAMARAFGDFCLKDFGLISVPDVSYHHVTEKDEFVVLATDGVWDVLSNKEVVDIVAAAPSHTTAARALVECAVRAWRLKFPTSKTDDCAAICLFLKDPCSSDRTGSRALQLGDTPTLESVLTGVVEIPVTGLAKGNLNGNFSDPASTMTYISQNTSQLLSEATRTNDEIEPVFDVKEEQKQPERSYSRRSLAECISTCEEEEYSALEGVARVNSLLNLPRFLSWHKRSISRRKWPQALKS